MSSTSSIILIRILDPLISLFNFIFGLKTFII